LELLSFYGTLRANFHSQAYIAFGAQVGFNPAFFVFEKNCVDRTVLLACPASGAYFTVDCWQLTIPPLLNPAICQKQLALGRQKTSDNH
jgi:hypothetical protein